MQPALPSPAGLRLATVLAALFLVVLALAIALPLLAERHAIRQLEEQRLHRLTQTLMLKVAQQLDVLHRSLDALRDDAAIWLLEPDGAEETTRRLEALGDAIPGLLAMRIIDPAGQSWASYNGERFAADTDPEDPQAGLLWVQTPLRAEMAGPEAVRVALPDRMPARSQADTIELLLDGDAFRLSLQASRYTDDTHLAVLGEAGQPLAVLPAEAAASSRAIVDHLQAGRQPAGGARSEVQVAEADPPTLDTSRLAAIANIDSELTRGPGTLRIVASRDFQDLYAHWWHTVQVRTGLYLLTLVVVVLGLASLRRSLWEQHRLRETALARQRLFASIVDSTAEGILITDRNGIIVEVNEAMHRISGYPRGELLGQSPRLFRSDRQPPEDYAALWSALADHGHWYGELWNRRRDGSVYPALLTVSAVRNDTGAVEHYAAIMNDITALKDTEAALQRLADQDALTGLPNRRCFTEQLSLALQEVETTGGNLALLFIDLDGFKQINDAHGHDIGDRLLRVLAQRLQGRLRQYDLLARLGGDEFIALLRQVPPLEGSGEDFRDVAQRLLHAAHEPVEIDALPLQVSASIGGVAHTGQGSPAGPSVDAAWLLRQADHAMYEAKVNGKNQIVFVSSARPDNGHA
ncbi:MAG: diguanylate cyclase [Pigmentiphaga sp.]|nr:diguanylate cyclase [Pigmentiphaga sp.]